MERRSPILQADSLPAEPQGKPENTRVGSLSLSPVGLPGPGIELGASLIAQLVKNLLAVQATWV